jgi:hypothetical protein
VEYIFKLVDSCNQNSLVFRRASLGFQNETLKEFADRIHQLLDRFSYELQTEIRRLGHGDFDPSRPCSELTENPQLLLLRCELGLKLALEDYRQACDSSLTAHARAMLKRQRSVIQLGYDQLVQLRQAA